MHVFIKDFRTVLLFLLMIIFCSNTAVFAGKWKVLRPESRAGVRSILVIDEKQWAYYHLKPGEEMNYSIPYGDRDLRIITRPDLGHHSKGDIIYNFRIGFNGNDLRLYSRATRRAKSVKVEKSKNRVGAKRIIKLKNNESISSLSLSIDDTAKYPVFFRIQVEREEYAETIPYISIHPEDFNNNYNINTNENIYSYYDVDTSQVLSVSVIGPTVLKINARLMMDESMHGLQKRGIQVIEEGELKNIYLLRFRASKVSTILEYPDQIPSRADKFFIEVPRGKHSYMFKVKENNGTIVLRFFIPEKDLTNAE